MSYLYPNGHVISPVHGPGPLQVCEVLVMRETHSAWMRARDRTDDEVAAVLATPDFEHGPDCSRCRGENVVRPRVIVGYECSGCGQRGPLEEFDRSCCLAVGIGAYEEKLVQHAEWHELDGIDDPLCPACVERRMLGAYAARRAARAAEAAAEVAGLEAFVSLLAGASL